MRKAAPLSGAGRMPAAFSDARTTASTSSKAWLRARLSSRIAAKYSATWPSIEFCFRSAQPIAGVTRWWLAASTTFSQGTESEGTSAGAVEKAGRSHDATCRYTSQRVMPPSLPDPSALPVLTRTGTS